LNSREGRPQHEPTHPRPDRMEAGTNARTWGRGADPSCWNGPGTVDKLWQNDDRN
jgi:hypothetical protein